MLNSAFVLGRVNATVEGRFCGKPPESPIGHSRASWLREWMPPSYWIPSAWMVFLTPNPRSIRCGRPHRILLGLGVRNTIQALGIQYEGGIHSRNQEARE